MTRMLILMKENLQFGVALLINSILVGLMVNYIWSSDSDKAIIILMIFYPVLTVLNFIIWIAMRLGRDPRYRIYKWMTFALIISFIPIAMIAGEY
jgi:hypothetical protein